MKGIVLAGGTGSRLHPITMAVSKQLLPVYDKPMIYYPLTTLMFAGIREVLLIATPFDMPIFKRLLGDGRRWGIQIEYAEQARPEGLAHAYIIGADFVRGEPSALILGDNIFFGHELSKRLVRVVERPSGATIFAYRVSNPEIYGVVEFEKSGKVVSIEEKPAKPRSQWAQTGLFFFDRNVVDIAASLKPSPRGELEITDVVKTYLGRGALNVELLGRGFAWLDTGSPDSLIEAAQFVRALEQRQGLRIACPEEVAFQMGFIDRTQFRRLGEELQHCDYGRYLLRIADEA